MTEMEVSHRFYREAHFFFSSLVMSLSINTHFIESLYTISMDNETAP